MDVVIEIASNNFICGSVSWLIILDSMPINFVE